MLSFFLSFSPPSPCSFFSFFFFSFLFLEKSLRMYVDSR